MEDWSGQRHTPAALYPWERPQYPLDRRLGGPQSGSEHRGQRKNPLSLPGIKPHSSSLQSDICVSIIMELYGGPYIGKNLTGMEANIWAL
jgi:hypothetical protein